MFTRNRELWQILCQGLRRRVGAHGPAPASEVLCGAEVSAAACHSPEHQHSSWVVVSVLNTQQGFWDNAKLSANTSEGCLNQTVGLLYILFT